MHVWGPCFSEARGLSPPERVADHCLAEHIPSLGFPVPHCCPHGALSVPTTTSSPRQLLLADKPPCSAGSPVLCPLAVACSPPCFSDFLRTLRHHHDHCEASASAVRVVGRDATPVTPPHLMFLNIVRRSIFAPRSSHSKLIILILPSGRLHPPSSGSFPPGVRFGSRRCCPSPPGPYVTSLLPAEAWPSRQLLCQAHGLPEQGSGCLAWTLTGLTTPRQCRGTLYTQEPPPSLPSSGQDDLLPFYRVCRWYTGQWGKQRNPNFHRIGLIFFQQEKKRIKLQDSFNIFTMLKLKLSSRLCV